MEQDLYILVKTDKTTVTNIRAMKTKLQTKKLQKQTKVVGKQMTSGIDAALYNLGIRISMNTPK